VNPTEAGAFDAALAEDALRAAPNVEDEAAGAIVAKLVRHGGPAICKAAATALASLWGARARPIVFGLLDNADDGVRIAAVAALRRIGGVDENAVARLERMLTRLVPAGDDLLATAAAALAHATPAARPRALIVAKRAIIPQSRSMLAVLRGSGGAPLGSVAVLALARTILELEGADGKTIVRNRATASDEPLRAQLLDLIGESRAS
jgi:hypothetical protein